MLTNAPIACLISKEKRSDKLQKLQTGRPSLFCSTGKLNALSWAFAVKFEVGGSAGTS